MGLARPGWRVVAVGGCGRRPGRRPAGLGNRVRAWHRRRTAGPATSARRTGEAVGLDNFLALGLIALAYGATVLLHAYGFLAVFAAGLALRREEMRHTGHRPAEDIKGAGDSEENAVHPEKAPAYMAEAVLGFNEQIEKLLEVVAVLVLGAMLAAIRPTWDAVGLAAALFVVVRPAAVFLGLARSRVTTVRRGLIGWFGVRGVGSLYYLVYAINHGVPADLGRLLADLVMMTLTLSIVAHGVSVTPLMNWYRSRVEKRGRPADSAGPAQPS